MAYARFSSDVGVYIFAHVSGGLACCGCLLGDDTRNFFSFTDLAEHLREHVAAGHGVPEHLLEVDTYDPDDFREQR